MNTFAFPEGDVSTFKQFSGPVCVTLSLNRHLDTRERQCMQMSFCIIAFAKCILIRRKEHFDSVRQ